MSYVIVASIDDGSADYFLSKNGTWITGFRMAEARVFENEEEAESVADEHRPHPTREIYVKRIL